MISSTPKDFCEQAKHFQMQRKIFYISLRLFNRFLPSYKIILELDQLINRNQKYIQWTKMKQWGPLGNFVANFNIYNFLTYVFISP